MSVLVDAAKAELQALEGELSADPRFQKAQQLRALLALYDGEVTGARPQPQPQPQPQSPPLASHRPTFVPVHKPQGVGRVRDPNRLKVLDGVTEVLRELGSPHPVKTGDIYDLLPEHVTALIGGTNPRSNLSALIHNSKRFVSHQRNGWTLPSDGPPADPTPAPESDNWEEGVDF